VDHQALPLCGAFVLSFLCLRSSFDSSAFINPSASWKVFTPLSGGDLCSLSLQLHRSSHSESQGEAEPRSPSIELHSIRFWKRSHFPCSSSSYSSVPLFVFLWVSPVVAQTHLEEWKR